MPRNNRPVSKEARLFRNNRSQAVRIPVEFELPGDRVLIRQDGGRLIIEPLRRVGLLGLLASWAPLDVAFPDVDDPDVGPENVL